MDPAAFNHTHPLLLEMDTFLVLLHRTPAVTARLILSFITPAEPAPRSLVAYTAAGYAEFAVGPRAMASDEFGHIVRAAVKGGHGDIIDRLLIGDEKEAASFALAIAAQRGDVKMVRRIVACIRENLAAFTVPGVFGDCVDRYHDLLVSAMILMESRQTRLTVEHIQIARIIAAEYAAQQYPLHDGFAFINVDLRAALHSVWIPRT